MEIHIRLGDVVLWAQIFVRRRRIQDVDDEVFLPIIGDAHLQESVERAEPLGEVVARERITAATGAPIVERQEVTPGIEPEDVVRDDPRRMGA